MWAGILFSAIFLLPQISHAATLFLSPSSGDYNAGGQISISVKVNTEGESINAVDGTIGFNPAMLEVKSVAKGSVMNLWVQEPSYSNSAGNVNFGGVVLNPGYSGSSGNIIIVVFKAKATGKAEVNFKAGSVLANDGYGTNVLKAMNGASFNIATGAIQQQPLASPKAEAPVVVSGFEISSSTHPDQNKWYSNNDPVFQIKFPSDAKELNLVLSRNEKSTPKIKYTPPIFEKILEDVEEGAWYLHANYRDKSGLSQTIKYKFQVDTEKPSDFNITRVDKDDLTNPQPEILFESSDELSGLDHYELKIGEGEWFTISPDLAGKSYKLPFQSPGTREVLVKAIDKAGNSISSNTEIVIKPVSIPPPLIKEVVLPKTSIDKVAIIKEEVEVVVKEVVVKEVVVKEVVVKGLIVKDGVVVKVAAVIVDILKLENSNSLGQISDSVKDANKKLIKTIEIPVDENYNFEAKIDNLEAGTYIIRTYAKDVRGAISDAFSDVVLKVAGESTLAKFVTWVSGAIMSGFDSLVRFLSEGWFLIAVVAIIASLFILIVKRVVPHLAGEIEKIRYIASEYRAQKKLKKLDHKTKLELKILEKDIKKELELLSKIANHRSLHPEESYLKNKLEKYHNTLKKL